MFPLIMSRAVRLTMVGLLGCLIPLAGVVSYCSWEWNRIWSPMPWAEATVIQQSEDEIWVRWQDRNGEERRAAIGLYDTSDYPPQERIEILYDLDHPARQVVPQQNPGMPYEDRLITHGFVALLAGLGVIAVWCSRWFTVLLARRRSGTAVRPRVELVRGRLLRVFAVLIVVWAIVGVLTHVLTDDLLTVVTALGVALVLTVTPVLAPYALPVRGMDGAKRPALREVAAPHAKRTTLIALVGSTLIGAGLMGYGIVQSVRLEGVAEDSTLGGYYLLAVTVLVGMPTVYIVWGIRWGRIRTILIGPSSRVRAWAGQDEHGRVWLELHHHDDDLVPLWLRVSWEASLESFHDGTEVEVRGRFEAKRRLAVVSGAHVLVPNGRLRTYPPNVLEPMPSDRSVVPELSRWWWSNAAFDYGVLLLVMGVLLQIKEPMSGEVLFIVLALVSVFMLNMWAAAGTHPTEGIRRLPWRR